MGFHVHTLCMGWTVPRFPPPARHIYRVLEPLMGAQWARSTGHPLGIHLFSKGTELFGAGAQKQAS